MATTTDHPTHCPMHTDTPVKFYCTNCEERICAECVLLYHMEHTRIGIDDLFKETEKKLKEALEEAEDEAEYYREQVHDLKNAQYRYTGMIERANDHLKVKRDMLIERIQQKYEESRKVNNERCKQFVQELLVELKKAEVEMERAEKIEEEAEDACESLTKQTNIETYLYPRKKRIEFKIPNEPPVHLCLGHSLVGETIQFTVNNIDKLQPDIEVECDATVISRIPWSLSVRKSLRGTEMFLAAFLYCHKPEAARSGWSVKAEPKLRVRHPTRREYDTDIEEATFTEDENTFGRYDLYRWESLYKNGYIVKNKLVVEADVRVLHPVTLARCRCEGRTYRKKEFTITD